MNNSGIEPVELTVSCYECGTIFDVMSDKVDVELDEVQDGDYDYYWLHVYRAECPKCNQLRIIDITNFLHLGCCLNFLS